MKFDAHTLAAIAPHTNPKLIDGLCAGLNKWLPVYGITQKLVVQHFICQSAEETDGFRVLQEYASGAAYEGRKDLGNVVPGDGRRFPGRGVFMITGRANYAATGKAMGLDLVAHPELLLDPSNAVHAACLYWQSRGLTALALKDDVKGITKKINGGYNGLATRVAYLDAAKRFITSDLDGVVIPPKTVASASAAIPQIANPNGETIMATTPTSTTVKSNLNTLSSFLGAGGLGAILAIVSKLPAEYMTYGIVGAAALGIGLMVQVLLPLETAKKIEGITADDLLPLLAQLLPTLKPTLDQASGGLHDALAAQTITTTTTTAAPIPVAATGA